MKYFLTFLLLLVNTYITYAQLYDKNIKPADTRTDEYIPILLNKRVGLIINQTAMVDNKCLLDLLLEKNIKVAKIFVPEHGFRGKEDAGAKVDNSIDSATAIPVLSLYGSHKKPKPEDIEDIDILVYDLQDVGVRFYTYISTLQYCMEACAENNKKFLILDRPNPNGFYVAGPVLEKENTSFVGMQSIPIVYGMTVAEYATMLKGEKWFNKADSLDLMVIPCVAYTHAGKYKLPIAPSPNLKTMAAVYAYPSLCLLEGTPISVGRGTDTPFGQFGCPEFKEKYAHTFMPISTTGAKKPLYENLQCYGKLIEKDENKLLIELNNNLNIDWIIEAYNSYPEKDKFFSKFFKKLAGTGLLEEQIKTGVRPIDIKNSWQNGITEFLKIRKKYLIYN